ncbi:MAG: FAD-binding protein [Polyangiaceae bacterium]|nr:FAD-binding protein [Polyangiaceae bacterium]
MPAVSPAARDKAKTLLLRALGPSKVKTDPDDCAVYSRDESEAEGMVPDAVVLAEAAEDVLLALAVAREAGVPITPRAGGTGRTGGAVPVGGGIVLSLLGMNAIKEIDRREQIAVVGPGTVLSELHAAVEREGLFYPPDPNSSVGCALGGNVAENSGGPRGFKYGVTGDYVLGMEAFLIGGQRLSVGRRTRKGTTGYDLTSLLVGSEGTLAVFGDLTLRLLPKPEGLMTLMALFEDERGAARAVEEITGRGLIPRCIEFFDATTLQAVRDAKNPIDERARAMLMIEVDGDEAACEVASLGVADACEASGASEVLVAQEPAQREKLWAARKEMSPAVRKLAKHKLSEDVVVPRQQQGELLTRVRAVGERLGVRTLAYGHAGDGNFHVNFLWDDPDEVPRVDAAIEALFRDVIALGGTLTGEHGIGVLKAPYLPLEQASELIGVQRAIKGVFDPQGLLNPGKIFPARGHRDC